MTVRRGMRVAELVQGPAAIPGTPHVTACAPPRRTDPRRPRRGRDGRRRPPAKWLAELGAIEPYIESEGLRLRLLHAVLHRSDLQYPAEHGRADSVPAASPCSRLMATTRRVRDPFRDERRSTAQDVPLYRSFRPRREDARFTRTGSTASRSPTCWQWPVCSTATGASSFDGRPIVSRLRGSRGRLGLHESVGRPRDQRRHLCATPAQGRARAPRRSLAPSRMYGTNTLEEGVQPVLDRNQIAVGPSASRRI